MALAVIQGGSLLFGSGERLKPLSKRYTSHSDDRARRNKDFPYDVPYLPKRAVWQLVEQHKPLYFSDRVFVRLTHDVKSGNISEEILTALSPLRGQQLRFTLEEFRHEMIKLLGHGDFAAHKERLSKYCQGCATISAAWTPERAEAHLQEDDMLKRRASASDRLWAAWVQETRRGKTLTESNLRKLIRKEQLEQMLTPPMWMMHQARIRGCSALQLWAEDLQKRGTSLESVRASHAAMVRG